jgi:hypothetical protein
MEDIDTMKMRKLAPVDTLQSGDLIKAVSSQKAVPVQYCLNMKVGSVDLYMDKDFEGFYRPFPSDVLQNVSTGIV